MKGGFFVSHGGGLFASVERALLDMGGQGLVDLDGGMVQLEDPEGRLITVYERVPPGTEWEFREGPFWGAPGVEVPDMKTVVACPFECRWTDLVVRVAVAVAAASGATWVLDGDGVVWDATRIDLRSIRL